MQTVSSGTVTSDVTALKGEKFINAPMYKNANTSTRFIMAFDTPEHAVDAINAASGKEGAKISELAGFKKSASSVTSVRVSLAAAPDPMVSSVTVSSANQDPPGVVRAPLLGGIYADGDEAYDELNQMNAMEVNGKMYNPATGYIEAEGYMDLMPVSTSGEGKYESDSASANAWVKAGSVVAGSEVNNQNLQLINAKAVYPNFELAEEEVPIKPNIDLVSQYEA